MNQMAAEWCRKAEEDWIVAERELSLRPAVYSAVCFHAQQCGEKYLKATLLEAGKQFPHTHDLEYLAGLALDFLPGLKELSAQIRWLTQFGVEVRYPGVWAEEKDARRSVEIVHKVRSFVLQFLAPQDDP